MILLSNQRYNLSLMRLLYYRFLKKESSQFEFYFPNTTSAIQNLTESPLYTEDWIGLRTLDQRNGLHFLTMAGDHMDFDRDWFYHNIVVKYLT